MKMKNEEQENLPKWGEWVMANFAAIERDREETITAPDGKEYPIRDNDHDEDFDLMTEGERELAFNNGPRL